MARTANVILMEIIGQQAFTIAQLQAKIEAQAEDLATKDTTIIALQKQVTHGDAWSDRPALSLAPSA